MASGHGGDLVAPAAFQGTPPRDLGNLTASLLHSQHLSPSRSPRSVLGVLADNVQECGTYILGAKGYW